MLVTQNRVSFLIIKRAWFKETKPEVINQIDSQLRKRYTIGDDSKMVACVHYPPEKDCKREKIKYQGEQRKRSPSGLLFPLFKRHVMLHSVLRTAPETFEMRPWVSYKIPEMIGGML